jgi:hypothetical protein
VVNAFTGDACHWARTVTQVNPDAFDSWESFEDLVMERYSTHLDGKRAHWQLQACKQGTDPVDLYFQRFMTAALLVPFDVTASLPSYFAQGLRKDLVTSLAPNTYASLGDDATLNDWLMAIREVEILLARAGVLDGQYRPRQSRASLREQAAGKQPAQSPVVAASPSTPAPKPPKILTPPPAAPSVPTSVVRFQAAGAGSVDASGWVPQKFKDIVYDFLAPEGPHRANLLKDKFCLRCESHTPAPHPYWTCTGKPVRPFAGGISPKAATAAYRASKGAASSSSGKA